MLAKIEEATTSRKVLSEEKELTPKLKAARGATVSTDIIPVPTWLHHAPRNFVRSLRTSRTCQAPVLIGNFEMHDRTHHMPVITRCSERNVHRLGVEESRVRQSLTMTSPADARMAARISCSARDAMAFGLFRRP